MRSNRHRQTCAPSSVRAGGVLLDTGRPGKLEARNPIDGTIVWSSSYAGHGTPAVVADVAVVARR